jgi:predicted transcriptional regulator
MAAAGTGEGVMEQLDETIASIEMLMEQFVEAGMAIRTETPDGPTFELTEAGKRWADELAKGSVH